MADRPMVSAGALSVFHAHLPSGLDETQVDKLIVAAGELSQEVWREASRAHVVATAIRNDFQYEDRLRKQTEALAAAFDSGWEAHRREGRAQEKDPSHAIRRSNPWQAEVGS